MQTMIRRRPAGIAVALLAVLVLAACAGAMGEPPPPAGEARTLEHQGIERHYYLHNIEAAASAPVPLVVSLHGYRGTEQALTERNDLSQIAWDALDRVASREGFVVAYPHAWLGQWSLFEGLENIALDDGRTVDDVGFVARMIARLVGEGLADAERVYLTGFSDGAIRHTSCSAPPRHPLQQPRPPPARCIRSTATPARRPCRRPSWPSLVRTTEACPMTVGCSRQGGRCRSPRPWSISACSTAARARRPNFGTTGTQEIGVASSKSSGPAAGPRAVKLLRVEGGGHNWPSHEPLPAAWRGWSGTHNRDIESAEEIWAFLRQFRKGDVTP